MQLAIAAVYIHWNGNVETNPGPRIAAGEKYVGGEWRAVGESYGNYFANSRQHPSSISTAKTFDQRANRPKV
jgi:hypothetical protein